jgi:hypothetical protein
MSNNKILFKENGWHHFDENERNFKKSETRYEFRDMELGQKQEQANSVGHDFSSASHLGVCKFQLRL